MIPPEANAGFVAAMEDVLETYQRPRDPDRPLVCLDETSKQLIALVCSPAPEGFARWSLRLLEEKVVELHIVDKASDNTIGRTLKKRP